jgi:hypothetical protein
MLTHTFVIEVPMPFQIIGQSCICVLEVSILPLYAIFLLDLGKVPTVRYCRSSCYFIFLFLEPIVVCIAEIIPMILGTWWWSPWVDTEWRIMIPSRFGGLSGCKIESLTAYHSRQRA